MIEEHDATTVVLRMSGELHAGTYRDARDGVIKAALTAPALVVDVDGLRVTDRHAWSVFTSARWHVHAWPDVPIALACGDRGTRRLLASLSITRYVPVYASVDAAARAVADASHRYRRRAAVDLDGGGAVRRAQAFVKDRLRQWRLLDAMPAVLIVSTVFVENAMEHGGGSCTLRLETDDVGADGGVVNGGVVNGGVVNGGVVNGGVVNGGVVNGVVVAVTDANPAQATRREQDPTAPPTGLDLVAAVSHGWRNLPTPQGKTVWALIRPQDDFLTGIAGLVHR
ncbi:STAS domain-containing protein [Mycolicibacterium grossiae]|nr:STAS domain-containing protein [Mycolicibacterium grossiae]